MKNTHKSGLLFWGVFILLCQCIGSAQPLLQRFDSVKVFDGVTQLKNPWAGGLNFTEWSAIDLDLDGDKDIVVFDKSGEKIRAFLNDGLPGQESYTHAPQLQYQFPKTVAWCIFYDYNNDGKADLFTYSLGQGGIRVYRNTSSPGTMQFTLAKSTIQSVYFPLQPPYNLYCSQVAIPGLADVDGDKDMDILSFSVSGTSIEYHKNKSMDLYGNCDSLVFDRDDECWGDFDENMCTSHLNSTLQGCPPYHKYLQATQPYLNTDTSQNRHAGSCIMCYDADGDKDIDLVLGDISCDSVEFYRNAGSLTYSHIDSISKKYPAQHVASFKQFPCTYFLDVDNDNKRDLIASPNITNSENYQSVWQYKNMGQDSFPDFQFVKKNFMQEGMIELGEGAYPAVFDYEGDGDLDLLVGNFGYYTPPSSYSSKLALYLNTGTPSHPQFQLSTRDFQNLSAVTTVSKAPALADFDNDGDVDLFIGDYSGRLSYYQNTAGIGVPPNFVLLSDYATTGTFLYQIDIGSCAAPFVVDIDRDGLKDLIVGGYNGTLTYFRNTSTSSTNLSLTLVKSNWGGVKVVEPNYVNGLAMPCIYDDAGTYKVLIGSERGYVYLYGNIESNLNSGNFTLIDSIYTGIVEGEHVAPCLADFNNDGYPDMVLGNYSGGLAYFKGLGNISVNDLQEKRTQVSLFPNPAKEMFTLKFDAYNLERKEIEVVDAIGRSVLAFITSDNTFNVNTSILNKGVYFVKILTKNNTQYIVKKLLIN